MEFTFSPEQEALREAVRSTLAAEAPMAFVRRMIDDERGFTDDLWQKLAGLGWLGLDVITYARIVEELSAGWMSLSGVLNTHMMVATLLRLHGTPEQKSRWLPGILSADEHWCQGFSEPQAGSDLANLRCLATRDGDEYVVEGTKIWISTAHIADWGLFLVRTDPTAIERKAKHEGITALIVDMHGRGIECRPIRDITGDEMFNEVVFDGARVPVAYHLGEEGQGWQVAMGTLGHERIGTAGMSITLASELDRMIATVREHNPAALDDPDLRDRLARAWTQITLTRLLNYRALSKVLKGEKNWPEVPLAKLQWSHLSQTLAELGCDLLGPAGILSKGGPDAVDQGHWTYQYCWQRYTSIGAGTTEVQKNIIADRAIALPRR